MKRIGIITALLREASCLPIHAPQPGQIIHIDTHTTLCICGMGMDRAKDAAQRLIAAGCEGLLSWGTCAGLEPPMRAGDLIIPETIVVDGGQINTDEAWRGAVIGRLAGCPGALHFGALSGSQHLLHTQEEKRSLRRRSQAQAVDMESAAIAAVATQNNIPFIALRAVSDSACMAVPEMVMRFTGPFGEVQTLKLMATLLRNPHRIPALIRLGMGFKAASRTLKWIGRGYGEILQFESGVPTAGI